MKKILVIDDDRDIREQVVTVLQYEGFQTMSADNGRSGVKLAKKHLPDLIICDVTMPEVSGYRVLADIRSNPMTENVPFIFLTGMVSPEDMRRGMRLGADDYLTKPFNVEELLAAIQTRFERHEASQKQIETLRKNLSGMLPHELRTPLTSLLGFAQYLTTYAKDLAKDPVEIEEVGKALYDSAIRLNRLVENYLLHADLILMEQTPEKQEYWRQSSIPILTKAIVPMMARRTLERFGRENDLHLELCEATLYMVEEHLAKILDLLLDNACKFSEDGAPILLASRIEQRRWCLSITDFGRGMTDEQIALVGAYMQFDREVHEQQGAGLGLAIVQKLLDFYLGDLKIESIPNQNTIVTISLPVGEAQ
ncbi:response regulator receiver domain protein [Candidatus Moduliflexus flocculans]|uniref:histidine kinase n=1 Tax=Candidatus Moduliflexus flocculans TaxID=1499966 RepID=A0A081BRL1_9BACT|nr:response regulator receiver domain protein [Candidatus Moduliflexus flocculans]